MSKVNFCAVGDLMLGHSHSTYWRSGIGMKLRDKNLGSYFNGFKKLLPPILFANLECVPVADPDFYKKPILTNINVIPHLADLGLKVVSMANNHIFDNTVTPVFNACDKLSEHGIECSGFADKHDKSTIVKIGNTSIGFMSFCLVDDPGSGNLKDEIDILRVVKKNNDNQDHLFVSLHWGKEFMPFPSRSQIIFSENLINAGASGIIGHHPHVLQPVALFKNKPIMYSLGNFISDMHESGSRIGAIATITIEDEDVSVETQYTFIDDDFKPCLINEQIYEQIVKILHSNVGIERRSYFLRNIQDVDLNFIKKQIRRKIE